MDPNAPAAPPACPTSVVDRLVERVNRGEVEYDPADDAGEHHMTRAEFRELLDRAYPPPEPPPEPPAG